MSASLSFWNQEGNLKRNKRFHAQPVVLRILIFFSLISGSVVTN